MEKSKITIKNKKQPYNSNYSKFSGMAIQMLAVIGLSLWGGMQIDKFFLFKFPVFTIVLVLLGIFGSMYLLIKSVSQNN